MEVHMQQQPAKRIGSNTDCQSLEATSFMSTATATQSHSAVQTGWFMALQGEVAHPQDRMVRPRLSTTAWLKWAGLVHTESSHRRCNHRLLLGLMSRQVPTPAALSAARLETGIRRQSGSHTTPAPQCRAPLARYPPAHQSCQLFLCCSTQRLRARGVSGTATALCSFGPRSRQHHSYSRPLHNAAITSG